MNYGAEDFIIWTSVQTSEDFIIRTTVQRISLLYGLRFRGFHYYTDYGSEDFDKIWTTVQRILLNTDYGSEDFIIRTSVLRISLCGLRFWGFLYTDFGIFLYVCGIFPQIYTNVVFKLLTHHSYVGLVKLC